MSPAGLDLCVYCECDHKGPDLVAYRDAVGVPTYGVGAIVRPDGKRVQMGDTITLEAALKLFLSQIDSEAAHYVRAWAPGLNQHQFDALTDFCYNRGAGRLRALLAMPGDISHNLLSFDWAGTPPRVLLGLQRRRRMEQAMYNGLDWTVFKEWKP